MKPLSPSQSLVFLLISGLAIGGWIQGVKWKRSAATQKPSPKTPAAGFTQEEKVIVALQDQVTALNKEVEALQKRLRELGDPLLGEPKPSPPADGSAIVPLESIVLPSSEGPALPAPPQKIETH
ncbi:MAG: DUF5320 domain-containing protein [Verrucomicrobiales bacterium]|nr:DUF5320 domain-containing protein [Verrucomicrobiales bacterium]